MTFFVNLFYTTHRHYQDFSKLEQQLKDDPYKETINLLSDLQVKFMRMFVRLGNLLAAPTNWCAVKTYSA